MIIDTIENASLYLRINSRIKIALNYIEETDFFKLELGKHVIDDDNIYAMILEYETKCISEGLLETHRNYIDV